MTSQLKKKAIRSGFWVFFTRVLARIFSFLRLVVLARLLAPDDFGLMGVALLSLATLETFSEPGLDYALIQKKKEIKGYLNPAWTFLVLRGSFLFLLLFGTAPYLAAFFRAPEATWILRLISFSILVQGMVNTGLVYFRKNLEFNKQFLYELSGTLADFLVAISLALWLRSVWALAFGYLTGSLARLLASYFLHPWRPRFEWDWGKIKDLFHFSQWVMGSNILVFLIIQGDDLFVGRFLGITALGFYQMAYKIANLPATEISQVIAQVTFPAYSKVQENLERLRRAYSQVFQGVTLSSLLLAGFILVFAQPFTKIILGEKWLPMVPAMRIMALSGLFRAIGAATGAVFYAVGKPKIETRWQLIDLLILVLLIYPLAVKNGITGVALAVLISTLVATIGFIWEASRITHWPK
jgi:lipopolysaccharide exporter